MFKEKIYIIIILLIIAIFCFSTCVQAFGDYKNSINDGQKFGEGERTIAISSNGIHNILTSLYKLLMILAIIAAVVYGFYIASQIIFGSITEKVDAKKMIIDYLLVVVAMALVPTIFGIILKFVKK